MSVAAQLRRTGKSTVALGPPSTSASATESVGGPGTRRRTRAAARHGTAHVSSWIKALENDPKEIRAAAIDAQRSTDRLLARECERSREDDTAAHELPDGGAGQTREPRDPERPPRVAPEVMTGSQGDQDAARRGIRAVAAGVQPGGDPRARYWAEPVTRPAVSE